LFTYEVEQREAIAKKQQKIMEVPKEDKICLKNLIAQDFCSHFPVFGNKNVSFPIIGMVSFT
jgi:hypothetical protein